TKQGAGNITLINTGIINSGSTGIVASNTASTISAASNSFIFVSNSGTITAGPNLQPNSQNSHGIWAGYGIATQTSTFGTVVIDNNGNVTAGTGSGIIGFNNSNGNITINDGPDTIVSGTNLGIQATANNRGNDQVNGHGAASSGDVTINLSQNAT